MSQVLLLPVVPTEAGPVQAFFPSRRLIPDAPLLRQERTDLLAGRAGVSGDEKGCVSRRSAARLPRSRSAGPGVASVLRRARPRAGAAAVTRCLVRRTSAIGVSTAARAATCRRPTAWSSASTARSGCEHLYRREIANTVELAEEVAACLALCNEVRPRQTLGQKRPSPTAPSSLSGPTRAAALLEPPRKHVQVAFRRGVRWLIAGGVHGERRHAAQRGKMPACREES